MTPRTPHLCNCKTESQFHRCSQKICAKQLDEKKNMLLEENMGSSVSHCRSTEREGGVWLREEEEEDWLSSQLCKTFRPSWRS